VIAAPRDATCPRAPAVLLDALTEARKRAERIGS
jgi:hypothetical protein